MALGAWVWVDEDGNITGIQIIANTPEEEAAVQKAIKPLQIAEEPASMADIIDASEGIK